MNNWIKLSDKEKLEILSYINRIACRIHRKRLVGNYDASGVVFLRVR